MFTKALERSSRVWTQAEPRKSAGHENAETGGGKEGQVTLGRATDWKEAREDPRRIYSSTKTASWLCPGTPATWASCGLWVNSAKR